MRKLFLTLFFVLMLGPAVLCAQTEPTPAEAIKDDVDAAEVKKVIESFLGSYEQLDAASMIKHISRNYLEESEGRTVGYEDFKGHIVGLVKNLTAISITGLTVLSLEVSNNTAAIAVEYKLNAFNLSTLESIQQVQKRKLR
jgi:hypothetical protein